MARFDLTDFEWAAISPHLPNKPRGMPRVDDRRVLNGIFWRLRTGAPWADIPSRYGPHTSYVNRFNRWRKAAVWAGILNAVSEVYDGDIQMIDSSSIRVHQHTANIQKKSVSLSRISGPGGRDPKEFRSDPLFDKILTECLQLDHRRYARPAAVCPSGAEINQQLRDSLTESKRRTRNIY